MPFVLSALWSGQDFLSTALLCGTCLFPVPLELRMSTVAGMPGTAGVAAQPSCPCWEALHQL